MADRSTVAVAGGSGLVSGLSVVEGPEDVEDRVLATFMFAATGVLGTHCRS